MVATLRLPRPLGAINNGLHRVETLHYYSDICSETRTVTIILGCCAPAFVRLVMSSLSWPTSYSSSASRSPRPTRPSSSSSFLSTSSSSESSTTKPLSVGGDPGVASCGSG